MMTSTRFWRLALAGVLIVVLVLSLLPLGPDAPTTGWDKTNHLLAFATLAVLGCLAYPGRIPRTLLALLAYGAVIEILQSFTDYRSAEWADLLADAIGLVAGWGFLRLASAVIAP